ncbi:MAG: hypothetical protein ACRD0H_10755 [Actinomycetes bacterium]
MIAAPHPGLITDSSGQHARINPAALRKLVSVSANIYDIVDSPLFAATALAFLDSD